MRKLSLALAGAVALASASAANATIFLDLAHTNVDITDFDNSATPSYINYQLNPNDKGSSFSEMLSFYNDTAGVYNLSVLTQMAANVTFTTLTLSGTGIGSPMTFDGPVANGTAWTYALSNLSLGVGTYRVNLAGTAPAHSSYIGTLNFSAAAVPEPATWGLMLLGFGLMGASMRRRRTRVALPQLA